MHNGISIRRMLALARRQFQAVTHLQMLFNSAGDVPLTSVMIAAALLTPAGHK